MLLSLGRVISSIIKGSSRAGEAHSPHFFCVINQEVKWKGRSRTDNCYVLLSLFSIWPFVSQKWSMLVCGLIDV
jgi:hypothetical protein